MNFIDKILNKLTMYRVVLYGLIVIVIAAFALSVLDILSYSLVSLAGSLALMSVVGLLSHWALVRLFKSAPNTESWMITVLILFLILKPAENLAQFAVLAVGVLLAMSSKYIFTYGNRHIFNPIAVALVILGLLGSGEIFWWVGSESLSWVVLIIGFLIVRKIHHLRMVLVFLVVAITMYLVTRGLSSESFSLAQNIVKSGPLMFFAFVMLTEPQTSPSTKTLRIIYAVVVGVFYGLPFEFPPLFSSPELALLIGNLFAFALSTKHRTRLELQTTQQKGTGIYEFSFLPDSSFKFRPGQYVEWTLPHKHTDSRGDRRYFTIASSPTEQDIKLVVRIDPGASSSFKKALLAMKPGDELWVSQLLGDFVLPRSSKKKLVLIAGGIGITPFRSMVRKLMDENKQRDMSLYYTSLSASSFAYWEMFNEAVKIGLRPNYVITGQEIPEGWTGKTGFLTADMIMTDLPDYKDRIYYLSGPNMMVSSYKDMLRKAGIPGRHIKTDYFPGF